MYKLPGPTIIRSAFFKAFMVLTDPLADAGFKCTEDILPFFNGINDSPITNDPSVNFACKTISSNEEGNTVPFAPNILQIDKALLQNYL